MPEPAWAIDGLFERNSLVMLAGPPASFKSFLAIDWMLCMSSGKKWNNRATRGAKVLYVLGEGKASLIKRIGAWTHYNNMDEAEMKNLNPNFRVSFEVPQLALKPSVDNMLAQLEREKYEPEVIVIDTFARSFVGLDENSQKDTGMWVENADRLRQLGYTVIFLHHTSKNTEFGIKYRGSTAIMGAMDTAMTLSRDGATGRLKLDVTKQKDHDEGSPMYFNRLVVKPDQTDPEGSCVLVPASGIDERFTPDGIKIEALLKVLLEDASFDSDRSRARELARQCGLSESAAQGRVQRARKHGDFPIDISDEIL